MPVEPIHWRGDALELLDQRRLPTETTYLTCRDAHEVAAAIRDMVVRGAPAIGVSAAFGMARAAMRGDDVRAAAEELRATRPTAVNLMWAIDRMLRVWRGIEGARPAPLPVRGHGGRPGVAPGQ